MPSDPGRFAPRRPTKLLGQLLLMVLNAVGDRLGGRVFVLQIGAGDGVTGVPLLERFRADGWSGLLIEPHPGLFAALEQLHRDSERVAVLNLGIAAQSATEPLHHVSATALARYPREMAAKASLDPKRLQGALAEGAKDAGPEDIAATDVPLLRLDTVLGELGIDRVDLVVVNAGGQEQGVLDSFDLAALSATAVLVDRGDAPATDDDASVAVLRAAGLLVFRIGSRLVGIRPDSLVMPMDDLLTFFGTAVGQEAAE